jgi:hypothetical protein
MPDPTAADLLAACLEAALEVALAHAGDGDGPLPGQARAQLDAIAGMARDPEALARDLAGG